MSKIATSSKTHVQKQPPHRSAWCPTLVAGAAAALLCATSAQAFETRYVYDNAGRPLFELNFYDQGERYQEYSYDTDPGYSPWQLSEDQKQAVMESFRLWTEILGPGSNIKKPRSHHRRNVLRPQRPTATPRNFPPMRDRLSAATPPMPSLMDLNPLSPRSSSSARSTLQRPACSLRFPRPTRWI